MELTREALEIFDNLLSKKHNEIVVNFLKISELTLLEFKNESNPEVYFESINNSFISKTDDLIEELASKFDYSKQINISVEYGYGYAFGDFNKTKNGNDLIKISIFNSKIPNIKYQNSNSSIDNDLLQIISGNRTGEILFIDYKKLSKPTNTDLIGKHLHFPITKENLIDKIIQENSTLFVFCHDNRNFNSLIRNLIQKIDGIGLMNDRTNHFINSNIKPIYAKKHISQDMRGIRTSNSYYFIDEVSDEVIRFINQQEEYGFSGFMSKYYRGLTKIENLNELLK